VHSEGVLRALESISVAARRLSGRSHGRPPFLIENEYDVQDLAETVLRGAAIDVTREDWTPKRAGAAKRIDLVIPSLESVIECKIVRDKAHARTIADELRIDFECYHDHPSCKNLYVYIYDPERRIVDPVQFCQDLNGIRRKRDHEFTVEISIGV
jgi:REase_DpnII-MboI